MTTKLPWVIRAQDYSKEGWHTRPTVGFELMFEFLRISPSYELARKSAAGTLTEEEKARLPADFELVKQTFALLGDVQTVLYRGWWLKRGLKVFGNPYSKPKAKLLHTFPAGEEVGMTALAPGISNYINETRRNEGLSAALLVAIPLGLRRSEIHKQIDALLGTADDGEQQEDLKPRIALMGKRLRAKVLFNGLRLLWFKAARPKWEYWRLGAKARISKTYSSALDASAARKTANAIEQVDRELMTRITYRALLKFENIAENAARGRFPSDAPVEKSVFNYPEIAQTILRKNAWERAEKQRVEELYASKKAAAPVSPKTTPA